MSLAEHLQNSGCTTTPGGFRAGHGRDLEHRSYPTPLGHRWPEGVLALPALDLVELESPLTAEALNSMLELCRTWSRSEFFILVLAHLSGFEAETAAPEKLDALKSVIERTCQEAGVSPQFNFEAGHRNMNLRVRLLDYAAPESHCPH